MNKSIVIISFFIFLISCKTEQSNDNGSENITTENKVLETPNLSKAEVLVNQSIEAHGGDLYKTAAYSFVFRSKEYNVINHRDSFNYSAKSIDSSGLYHKDVLTNNSFLRTLNDKIIPLTKKEESMYSQSLNSVVYFAFLPYKLNDASVQKKYVEETTIKDEIYDVVEVTFSQEGGGEDHEDEYYFWINKKDNKVDYFAYNYRVNGGGARFRSAFNRRIVDGVTFQDYINWEVSFETPLKDIPTLFENNKLKEVSRIELVNVVGL